jgi:hypothetical protein
MSSLPLQTLTLNVDQPIILLRNISTKRGMCNGTWMQITKLCHHVIEVNIVAKERHERGR